MVFIPVAPFLCSYPLLYLKGKCLRVIQKVVQQIVLLFGKARVAGNRRKHPAVGHQQHTALFAL